MSGILDREALAWLSKTTWISKEEWRVLLAESHKLQEDIRYFQRSGNDTAKLWEQLRPINAMIRSPLLKVSGIDDLKGGS